MRLFAGAAGQVALVTIQTWLIVHGRDAAVFWCGCLLSLAWTFNVKRVAFGGWRERVEYSLGAGGGALAGLWIGRALA